MTGQSGGWVSLAERGKLAFPFPSNLIPRTDSDEGGKIADVPMESVRLTEGL